MKSTAELRISGTYREDRHGDRVEIEKPKVIPNAPAHLTAIEKKIFNDVAQRMFESDFLTDLDVNTLELYAVQMALFRMAKKNLQKTKQYVTKHTNKANATNDGPSPWLKIMNDASDQLLKLQSKLGITPVDRKKISKAETIPDSPLIKEPRSLFR